MLSTELLTELKIILAEEYHLELGEDALFEVATALLNFFLTLEDAISVARS